MKSWEERLGGLLIAVRLDSIRSKIIALAVLATLAPALSTAVLSYVANRRALTESIEGELQGLGSQAAREVDLWEKELRYDVRVFVSSFEVSENLDRIPLGGARAAEALTRLTNYLTRVQLRYPAYVELLVVDAGGDVVASSRARAGSGDIPEDWLPRLARSETVVGEPYLDATLDSVAVRIGQPIESLVDGGYIGVLMATLTLGAVRDVLEALAPGEGGRVDLVMADGRRIVGSAASARLEPALPVGVMAALRAEPGGTLEYVQIDGAPVLGALTPIPRMEWSIVTEIPSEEAYAQFTQARNSAAMVLLGLLVFVGSVAYVLGLFIVRPLDRLARGARAVSSGDLTVDLPVTGGGEVGYLTKVFNGMVGQLRRHREELSNANAALREHNVELERLSITDALTGLYNRRYVMNELDKEVARAERHDRVLGVLMLDVDRFKDYNDTHGHLAGDRVLTGMGRVLEDATREHDVPGRFGGEEFIALLPDCDLEGALDAAERIRARLTEEAFEGGAVTCSIGAAEYPRHGNSPHAVIAAADAALYEAKAAGRDRVVAASTAVAPRATPADPAARRRTAKEREVVAGAAEPTGRKPERAASESAAGEPATSGGATATNGSPAERAAVENAPRSKPAATRPSSKKPSSKVPSSKKSTSKRPSSKKKSASQAASKERGAKKPPSEKPSATTSAAEGPSARTSSPKTAVKKASPEASAETAPSRTGADSDAAD